MSAPEPPVWGCSECVRAFVTPRALGSHMKVHPMTECRLCLTSTRAICRHFEEDHDVMLGFDWREVPDALMRAEHLALITWNARQQEVIEHLLARFAEHSGE